MTLGVHEVDAVEMSMLDMAKRFSQPTIDICNIFSILRDVPKIKRKDEGFRYIPSLETRAFLDNRKSCGIAYQFSIHQAVEDMMNRYRTAATKSHAR